VASAQAPPPRPEAAAARPMPPAPAGYSYNPEGRRDPFVSLLNRGSETKAVSVRPEGLPGLSVGDVAIRGIVANKGAYVAMIEAADGKTYIIRSGDKLYDATVKAVLADAIVFVQQVNDPLSLVKQREIRKPLRPTEEGK
jgi:Tfp pilus assembly protein PilP